MSFIHFSKEELNNLHFSLEREVLQANHVGAYSSSSLVNCNTRKYHGLLVVHQPQMDDKRYVLLASLDETILRGVVKVLLGTHRYPEIYHPQGYYYMENFSYEKAPKWEFYADDIVIHKEILLMQDEASLLIRYTIKEAKLPFQLQFDPFLSFRKMHAVGKCNLHANTQSEKVSNGIKLKMYSDFSDLFLQFSKKPEFVAAPDWNYNNEYNQERERGYEYNEDLYCPGYFRLPVKRGDQLIFSAGLSEINPRKLKGLMESELKQRAPIRNFEDCLENAARQFISHVSNGTEITAGFHWFGTWGRDTFISLPGLTLAIGQPEVCKEVIDTMLKDLKGGLFPNTGSGHNAAYNSADASLWFIRALQQYAVYTGTISKTWGEYGGKIKSILEHYRNGTILPGADFIRVARMQENGLLYTGEDGVAVTWMDAVVDGKPVTPRTGLAVELNALWYNAIRFALEAAAFSDDKNFIQEWDTIPLLIEKSFRETFWDGEKKYLADCVNGNQHDWSLRPNQIFAASLPYSPVEDEIKKSVLEKVKEKLLTPRGLRTLSPDDKLYKGIYFGSQHERDLAYHQGTVWPWLLGHFAEAYLKVYGDEGVLFIQSLYENFAPAVLEYGVGTIAEIYDGDEPHKARGAISQAWSVAELLRIKNMISTHISKKEIKEEDMVLQTI